MSLTKSDISRLSVLISSLHDSKLREVMENIVSKIPILETSKMPRPGTEFLEKNVEEKLLLKLISEHLNSSDDSSDENEEDSKSNEDDEIDEEDYEDEPSEDEPSDEEDSESSEDDQNDDEKDLEDVDYKEKKKMLKLIEHYSKPISDREFDDLVEKYEAKFGKYSKIGARGDRNVVALEYFMGSLDKKKTQKDIDLWVKSLGKISGKFLVDDKVDGVSCLYIKRGTSIMLRKRGDEATGTDLTYLVPYLNLPEINVDIDVRMELVIRKDIFEKKYSKKYSNARSMVAGVTNSKHFETSEVYDITPVAYQVLTDLKYQDKKSDQLKLLSDLGFTIPNPVGMKKLDVGELQEILFERESEAPYNVDGLVITSDEKYELTTRDNPKHACAFKGITETKITTVTHIEWKPSKNGAFKPIVHFDSVYLSEGNLSRVSGHNAATIVARGIGKGAKIEIVRSGKVIPYIRDVISRVEPEFPDEPYEWRGKDIVLIDGDVVDARVVKKNILFFFKTLEAKGISDKTIDKLYEEGYTSVAKIIRAKKNEISQIPSFGQRSAEIVSDTVAKSIENVEIVLLMTATGFFGTGFGKRKLRKIYDKYPDFLSWDASSKNRASLDSKLATVSVKTNQDSVLGGIKKFNEWLESVPEIKVKSRKSPSKTKVAIGGGNKYFEGKTFVFSGIRDKELEKYISDNGGNVGSGINKNTSVLVVKEKGNMTGKELKASEMKIPIVTIEEARSKM
jgi:DNA ligase (NAD+)